MKKQELLILIEELKNAYNREFCVFYRVKVLLYSVLSMSYVIWLKIIIEKSNYDGWAYIIYSLLLMTGIGILIYKMERKWTSRFEKSKIDDFDIMMNYLIKIRYGWNSIKVELKENYYIGDRFNYCDEGIVEVKKIYVKNGELYYIIEGISKNFTQKIKHTTLKELEYLISER